jgi:hypothetical protein
MIKKSFVFNLIFLLLLSVSLFHVNECLAQDYSAVVMDMTGKAYVQRGGKGEKASLNMGDLLYPGDAVAVEKDSTLTINYLPSSQQEKWPQGTKFLVGVSETKDAPAGVEKSIKEVLLPEDPYGGHMGGFVEYSEAPALDPSDFEGQDSFKSTAEGER